jgi:hypothetical protein
MHKITELEKRTTNQGGPPQSPFMLMAPPSPFPMNGHGGYPGNMSPMVSGSPFNMGFPSPGMGGPSRGHNVPHPQMYPSPMLHPNAHAQLMNAAHGNMNMLNGNGSGLHLQNTSPFRRSSTSNSSNDVFAGPLTPGIPSSAPSPYPYELGHGFPPGSMPLSMSTSQSGPVSAEDRSSPSEFMTREERRTSIEASVLRKKSGHLICQQDEEGPEAIPEEKEGEVIGLGMGDVLETGNESGQSQEQEEAGNESSQEHEQNGNGENGSEGQVDDLRSSLSPLQHFGVPTSNSGSNFTSNPPTPSPQSRLLTPSHLHNATLVEEMGSSRSSSSAYDNDNDKKIVMPISENGTRPPSPESPLWGSNLTASQLAQRKALAIAREQREAAAARKKAKGERVVSEKVVMAEIELAPEVDVSNGMAEGQTEDQAETKAKEEKESQDAVEVSV